MNKLRSIVFILLLTACQAGLDSDIRERTNGISMRNNNPGPWTNVMLILDGEYTLELDSLGAGDDTLLVFAEFKNQIGQSYAERGTRPRQLKVQAAQGMLRKNWR
jgi:hypothetical protein